ncbi:TonB-dependent receptor [Pedobacter sp. HMF7647]|uniref:TonB-dependent receptor n=1 Tax=Hufsiella arboris TaxID=2695275 RepID=A0A7K1Y603_9SPHI|nr:TonB-dependent receptor [Hufsiella arboris]MXV49870.1 TonB-dependent receptor [Hufsiella arboris]
MKQTLTYLIALVCSATMSIAQNKLDGSKITGKVVDSQQKTLDFATVSLLRAKDSSLVKTALTNENGIYEFTNQIAGNYLVSSTVVGMKKSYSNVFTLDESHQQITLPALTLASESKNLKEVSVTAKKPFVERKPDRMVVNVEGSTVASGNNALEVLQKSPGVTVDNDDNIALQGKKGVLVMIDGKQTYMSNADLANMLRNMQSSQIESIELITNPSSKYDASGTAGIINIKLKKDKKIGTNGTLTAGVGYGKNHRANTGLSLNHRNKKFNAFGDYNYSNNRRENNLQIDRITPSNNQPLYFGQDGTFDNHNQGNNFKVGADYFINKNNTLGVLVNGYINNSTELYNNRTFIGNSFAKADSSIIALNDGDHHYNNMSYNMNYKSVLDTAGQELTVDLDYSHYKGNDVMTYDNNYFNYATGASPVNSLTQNGTPSAIDIKAYKIDYTLPFNKTLKMEAGVKSSWVKTDNNFISQIWEDSQWENGRNSNHFVYDENVNAGYLNLSKQFKKTSVQLGLRAEQTNSKGNSITESKVVNRHYLDLFPTLFVNQSLGKNHDLAFSYSRRIDRPSYDALNPFVFYLDQYTYNQGNPYLNPQYTNSFELNYTFKKTYTVGFNYSIIHDVITEVLLPDYEKKALYQTNANLDKQINYNVNLNAPINFASWWKSTNNVTVFYMGFRAADLNGEVLDNGKVAVQLYSNQNFSITKTFSGELSGNYQSPLYYGTLKIQTQYSIDAGVNKSFMNKKLNLKFAVSDIFNTRNSRISSAYNGLNYSLYQKNETRVARLTLTYRFGSNDIKPERKRSTGLEAEQNRMKN